MEAKEYQQYKKQEYVERLKKLVVDKAVALDTFFEKRFLSNNVLILSENQKKELVSKIMEQGSSLGLSEKELLPLIELFKNDKYDEVLPSFDLLKYVNSEDFETIASIMIIDKIKVGKKLNLEHEFFKTYVISQLLLNLKLDNAYVCKNALEPNVFENDFTLKIDKKYIQPEDQSKFDSIVMKEGYDNPIVQTAMMQLTKSPKITPMKLLLNQIIYNAVANVPYFDKYNYALLRTYMGSQELGKFVKLICPQ